jgi:hypothetical protein
VGRVIEIPDLGRGRPDSEVLAYCSRHGYVWGQGSMLGCPAGHPVDLAVQELVLGVAGLFEGELLREAAVMADRRRHEPTRTRASELTQGCPPVRHGDTMSAA